MLAPGWITFGQSAGVTVTVVPLRTAAPLGADPIAYTTNRPHTAHGDQTPAEFAAAWTTINEPEVAERLDHSTGLSHLQHAMSL